MRQMEVRVGSELAVIRAETSSALGEITREASGQLKQSRKAMDKLSAQITEGQAHIERVRQELVAIGCSRRQTCGEGQDASRPFRACRHRHVGEYYADWFCLMRQAHGNGLGADASTARSHRVIGGSTRLCIARDSSPAEVILEITGQMSAQMKARSADIDVYFRRTDGVLCSATAAHVPDMRAPRMGGES